ncbi:hypothetical protein L210DRAFT_3575942, partial [Boletus edulis BED1]
VIYLECFHLFRILFVLTFRRFIRFRIVDVNVHCVVGPSPAPTSNFLLFSFMTVLVSPFAYFRFQRAIHFPLTRSFDPSETVDKPHQVHCGARDPDPSPRGVILQFITAFVCVLVLNYAVGELISFLGVQYFDFHMTIFSALPESTLKHLTSNPFHPTHAPVLRKWWSAAARQQHPAFCACGSRNDHEFTPGDCFAARVAVEPTGRCPLDTASEMARTWTALRHGSEWVPATS